MPDSGGSPSSPQLTTRQRQALEWLRGVETTTSANAKAAGFTTRTLNSLVEHGLATREAASVHGRAYWKYTVGAS